jgi:23S rRNA (adenine2503-C2)-methyltransferase
MKKWLLGLTVAELEELAASLSLPRFTAGQIAHWLYVKRVNSVEEMTNLSKKAREAIGAEYQVGGFEPLDSSISSDGTVKYLFPSLTGTDIESVMIPDRDRKTLCISSQAGCRMGCSFCMTGRMGYSGNLTTGEILSQIMNVPESDEITNVVFMGMGEPLDNYEAVLKSTAILTDPACFGWSPKRITVSTIGVIEPLKDFLDNSKCHLAVSVHNAYDIEREQLMPVQRKWRLSDIVSLVKKYDFSGQRRVSFEYIMFHGWNDSKRHADELVKLFRGLECRVNLIRFHAIPDFPYVTSPDVVIAKFSERLNKAGIFTTVRASRGEDILAACGMLSSKKNKESKESKENKENE